MSRPLTDLDSLALSHSWPLFEAARRMSLKPLMALRDTAPGRSIANDIAPEPLDAPIGLWSCNLRDEALSWSPAVFALFGIPDDEPLTRSLCLSCYLPDARRAMEQLRAHAIGHRRGFTMDARIRRTDGDTRWMRLSAVPILCAGKAVRLCGTKQDVTADYDGTGWRSI